MKTQKPTVQDIFPEIKQEGSITETKKKLLEKRETKEPTTAVRKSIMKECLYFCATANHQWGKGLSIKEAKKNAYVSAGTKYVVWACICEEFESESDRKNILACISADNFSGNPKFYDADGTQEDTDMIEKYLIGWAIVEDTTKK